MVSKNDPNNKGKEARERYSGRSEVQFINYDLSIEQKAGFKAWAHKFADNALQYIEDMNDAGYGISCKWDTRAECYSAFATCNKPDDPNKGWILSGRGSTVFSALMGVFYRHSVLFEGVWPVDTSKRFSMDDL